MKRFWMNIIKICFLVYLQLADPTGRSGAETKEVNHSSAQTCPSSSVICDNFLLLYKMPWLKATNKVKYLFSRTVPEGEESAMVGRHGSTQKAQRQEKKWHTRKQSRLEIGWGYKFSKLSSTYVLPLARLYLLKVPQSPHIVQLLWTKYSRTWAYVGRFSLKPLQMLTTFLEICDVCASFIIILCNLSSLCRHLDSCSWNGKMD